jgi:putative IMPACT (imprinted ancient) family translation regulator
MSEDAYRTIEGPETAAFGIRVSEFIGHARPVRSIEATEAFLEEVAETHETATHVVPAYRIRMEKAGDSGSIRATTEAIEDAGVSERQPHESIRVTVTYDDSGTVRGIIESACVEFEAVYEEEVTFEVAIPREDADGLRDRIRSATGGRAEIEYTVGQAY